MKKRQDLHLLHTTHRPLTLFKVLRLQSMSHGLRFMKMIEDHSLVPFLLYVLIYLLECSNVYDSLVGLRFIIVMSQSRHRDR